MSSIHFLIFFFYKKSGWGRGGGWWTELSLTGGVDVERKRWLVRPVLHPVQRKFVVCVLDVPSPHHGGAKLPQRTAPSHSTGGVFHLPCEERLVQGWDSVP